MIPHLEEQLSIFALGDCRGWAQSRPVPGLRVVHNPISDSKPQLSVWVTSMLRWKSFEGSSPEHMAVCFILPGIEVMGWKMNEGIKPAYLRTCCCFILQLMTVIAFVRINPALFLPLYSLRALGWGTTLASATCWSRCASVTGRDSETAQLKAVETAGMKKEKASEGKHLFSLPLAMSGTFLIIEMLKLAEVAEWVGLVII